MSISFSLSVHIYHTLFQTYITSLQAGAYIFLWIDWYNGAWIGPVVAFIELVVVAWVYGKNIVSYL